MNVILAGHEFVQRNFPLSGDYPVTLPDRLSTRRAVLTELGGRPETIQKVLAYCENHFVPEKAPTAPILPMFDEPHLSFWRSFIHEHETNCFQALQARLPQLCIPVRAGISKTPAYTGVLGRGLPFDENAFSGMLALERTAEIQVTIREHPAGALPVFITRHRPDFEMLVRALAFHHEPGPTSGSVNAQMVSGFLNWERVRQYQSEWIGRHGIGAINQWGQERQRVATTEKWRFYDRLMVVCEHPYSNVTANDLGLDMDEETWLGISTTLRLEHEFTHYATYRLYGYMSLNLLDETICDWAGMAAALGRFEGRWLLQFLGVENLGHIPQGARIRTYCSDLDQDAFQLVCRLMTRVAAGLEQLSRANYTESERVRFLIALTGLTLELLAADDRQDFFLQAYDDARRMLEAADSTC